MLLHSSIYFFGVHESEHYTFATFLLLSQVNRGILHHQFINVTKPTMDNGIYSLLAGSVADFNSVNTVANNTANTNTVGYKSDSTLFRSYVDRDVLDNISMPNDITNIVNLREGPVKVTKRPLDILIQGDGFFSVQTPNGIRYTRDGNFHLNDEYILSTAQGYPVISDNGDNITFETTDSNITIDANGNIYVDVAQGGGIQSREFRGNLNIVQFSNPKLMRKSLDTLMMSTEEPQQAESYRILQGALEESNVQPVLEMQRLIEVQRKFEGESHLIDNTYKMQKNAYDVMAKQGG